MPDVALWEEGKHSPDSASEVQARCEAVELCFERRRGY